MRLAIVRALSVVAVAAAPLAAQPANSVADFSGVQGQNGWYYGYWNRSTDADGLYAPTDFLEMTNFSGTYWSVGPDVYPYWTFLSADVAHPNGVATSGGRTREEQWAIRRFVTSLAGTLTVSGEFGKVGCGGDGTTAMILVNGASIFERSLAGCDSPGAYLAAAGYVAAGSTIDVVLTPGAASNDISDSSLLTAGIAVTATPEPGTLALAAGGLVALVGLRRRRAA